MKLCARGASRGTIRVMVSDGLVQAPAADVATVDQLLACAEGLMYAEKKADPSSRLAERSSLIR